MNQSRVYRLQNLLGDDWKESLFNLAMKERVDVYKYDGNRYKIRVDRDKPSELTLNQQDSEYEQFAAAVWELPKRFLLLEFSKRIGVTTQFFMPQDDIVEHLLYDQRFEAAREEIIKGKERDYQALINLQRKTPFGWGGGDDGSYFSILNTIAMGILAAGLYDIGKYGLLSFLNKRKTRRRAIRNTRKILFDFEYGRDAYDSIFLLILDLPRAKKKRIIRILSKYISAKALTDLDERRKKLVH